MKKDIHPDYNDEVAVKCSCGNTFTTGSTNEKIQVEICSNCHPAYTGKQKLVDSAGIVDKFKAKMKKTQELQEKNKKNKKKDDEESKDETTDNAKKDEKMGLKDVKKAVEKK